MLIAVSTLSPVRTQNLMPACFRYLIVGPTLSWSLSSIAVAPRSSQSLSISSYSDSIFFFRFCMDSFACLKRVISVWWLGKEVGYFVFFCPFFVCFFLYYSLTAYKRSQANLRILRQLLLSLQRLRTTKITHLPKTNSLTIAPCT